MNVTAGIALNLWNKNTIHYLSIPLGYRMWQKRESKLERAASMVRQVKNFKKYKKMKPFERKCSPLKYKQ